MKRKSSIIFDSLEATKLSRMYFGYRRFVVPCDFRSRLLSINYDHKASLLALLFCVATCTTQNLVTNRAFAQEAARRLGRAESITPGTTAVEQFASRSFERRSSQLAPSLLFGTTGDRGSDVSKSTLAPGSADPLDQLAAYEPALHQLQRARKSANLPVKGLSSSPARDSLLEQLVESASSLNGNNLGVTPYQRTLPYSLLFQPDSRSFHLASTYKVGADDSRVHSPEPTSPDVSILVNERAVHVKPLMEVRLGTYNLPIALFVPDPPGSLPGPR